jgi:hypothetical protein
MDVVKPLAPVTGNGRKIKALLDARKARREPAAILPFSREQGI